MAACRKCGERAPSGTSLCDPCYEARTTQTQTQRAQLVADAAAEDIVRAERLKAMPVSNVHTLPGHRVLGLSGVVSAESVFGMHMLKDMTTSLSDTFGGRSQTLERGLSQARTECLLELRVAADALGANAIIGIQLSGDIITPGATSSKMIMVTGLGTAVVALPE